MQTQYINLRNKPAKDFMIGGAPSERHGDLTIAGVVLASGDNIVRQRWFDELPQGYRDQVEDWIALGWLERLPVDDAAQTPKGLEESP